MKVSMKEKAGWMQPSCKLQATATVASSETTSSHCLPGAALTPPLSPISTTMMGVYNSCKRLKIQLLPDPVDNSSQGIYSGFSHSTTGELLVSVQSCSFCALIKESFLRVGHYHIPEAVVEEKLRLDPSSPVLLRTGRKEEDEPSVGMSEAGAGARLNSIEVLVGFGRNFVRGRIHLYAPKG